MDIKFEFDGEGPHGTDLSDLLPSSTTVYKDLHFSGAISTYSDSKQNESEDTEIESDDGSFKMIIRTASDEAVIYMDEKNKEVIEQTTFMGKTFLITDGLEKIKWKLVNEKIKYLDYECHKATAVMPKDGTDKMKEIVAWYTTQIPVSVGPEKYGQLPGAILMLSIDGDKTEIRATKITLETPKSSLLKKPTKGKKVTGAEYEKIIKERTKELEENAGEGSIWIRG